MKVDQITIKITKTKLKIEAVQRDIEEINTDLKYIKHPPIRAVAENMVQAKKARIENLKDDLVQYQRSLLG